VPGRADHPLPQLFRQGLASFVVAQLSSPAGGEHDANVRMLGESLDQHRRPHEQLSRGAQLDLAEAQIYRVGMQYTVEVEEQNHGSSSSNMWRTQRSRLSVDIA